MKPRNKLVFAAAALCVLASAVGWAQFGSWFQAPIPTISVEEISTAGGVGDAGDARGEEKRLLLVDVRSEREIAVSMIPGAISKAQYEADAERYADYRIVPYCTVGYRSGKYTKKLLDAGRDAANFEGSIIGWVNAGLPLVTAAGEATNRVHTWSKDISVPAAYVQIVN